MRASHYNQTDLCRPITGLEKCQEGEREREREREREGENLDIMKAPLLRRAALKIETIWLLKRKLL
jgi:hypothetical protein